MVENREIGLPAGRVESIDALRGFTMFWIIGAGLVVAGFNGIWDNKFTFFLWEQIQHVEWEGFRFIDLIQPLFLFVVGAFALSNCACDAVVFDESTPGITVTGGTELAYDAGATPVAFPNVIKLSDSPSDSSAYGDVTLVVGQVYTVSARRKTFDSSSMQFKLNINGVLFAHDMAYSGGANGTYQEITYEGVAFTPQSPTATVTLYDSGSMDARVDWIRFNEVPDPVVCGDLGTNYLPTDFNQDCYVNFKDLKEFLLKWLYCTDPINPDCDW